MKKQIINYEGLYELDEDGNVFATARQGTKGGLISHIKMEYLSVALSKKMKLRRFLLHRLLAIHFIPNPNNYPQINHIDGNKFNNVLSNLEWCNNSHNQLHAYRTGLRKKTLGSRNGNSKLIESQVAEIRFIAKERGRHYNRKELALKYSVSECTIKEIITRRKNLWQNVSENYQFK